MWVSTLVVFLAFTNTFADIESDVNACVESFDTEKLVNMESIRSNDDLKEICPMILNVFDCVENVLKRETGMSYESLAAKFRGTEIGRGAEVAKNVRNIFRDVCTEGSRLNEAVLADSECFDSMNGEEIDCRFKAEKAVESFAEKALEEGSDPFLIDPDCARAAHTLACVSTGLHDTCGRRAFDTFNEIVKRSSIFKNVLCSANDIEHLKTTFVDKLDVDDDKKDLFRLAFNLRKRRK